MAFLTLNFKSKALAGNTTVNIYLPETITEDMPVLYLLHGMGGDQNAWNTGSSIGKFVRYGSFAVVMPYGANSFYSNMRYGPRYFDYVSEELPEYICSLFTFISKKREKTFIGGLSMGGYGAVKIALRNPARFSAAASISGPMDILEDVKFPGWSEIIVANWGENYETDLKGSEDDLLHLVDAFPKDAPKPRIYAVCGTEDFLYPQNQTFRKHMEGKGFDFVYEEARGVHNWDFFGGWLKPALLHLFAPLMEAEKKQ